MQSKCDTASAKSQIEVLYEGRVIGKIEEIPHRMLSAEGVQGLVSGMIVEVEIDNIVEPGIVIIDERGTWIQLT